MTEALELVPPWMTALAGVALGIYALGLLIRGER